MIMLLDATDVNVDGRYYLMLVVLDASDATTCATDATDVKG